MSSELDERAARLMGPTVWLSEDGRIRGIWSPSTDLNDAAELFRAAPKPVQIAVQERVRDLWLGTILDPAALTRAIVKELDAHDPRYNCPECAHPREPVPNCRNCGYTPTPRPPPRPTHYKAGLTG